MEDKMIYATACFEISYHRDCEELVEEISSILLENMKRIMGFFRLEKLEKKISIVIYSEIGEYIPHVEKCGQTYYEWMIADTFDGRIHILSLEACRQSSSHARLSREEYARLIVHEFVHICQQQVEPNCYGCIWFWEALATNLAGQAMDSVEIHCSREELMFHYQELPAAYSVSYQLGKYMLEHLPYEQIYNYIRRPAALWEDTEEILEQAKHCG